MLDRRLNPGLLALALITALTMSACGQTPSSAPSTTTASTADVAASGLFRSTEEKLVIHFLKAVIGYCTVTKTNVIRTGGTDFTFTATVKRIKPDSIFWPQYYYETWEGSVRKVVSAPHPSVLMRGRRANQGEKPGAWHEMSFEI